MPVWKVRGLAYYPRKSWNPSDKPDLVTVKRPDMYSRAPDEWKQTPKLKRIALPVTADTKEEAEQRASDSKWMETVEGPTSRQRKPY